MIGHFTAFQWGFMCGFAVIGAVVGGFLMVMQDLSTNRPGGLTLFVGAIGTALGALAGYGLGWLLYAFGKGLYLTVVQ